MDDSRKDRRPALCPIGSKRTGLMLAAIALASLLPVLVQAAQPSIRTLSQSQWPPWPRVTWFYGPEDIQFAGRHAYVALGGRGLGILEVRSPTNLVQVGGCKTGEYAWRVAVSGNYAYVAGDGLNVIDVSNPAIPVRVGGYASGGAGLGTDVKVVGNYAYVGGGSGLQVLDIRDPTNCVRVGGYDGNTAVGVAIVGNYAYVAEYEPALQVIDISDPTNCVRLGGLHLGGRRAFGVTVADNHAYLATIDGLHVIVLLQLKAPVWRLS